MSRFLVHGEARGIMCLVCLLLCFHSRERCIHHVVGGLSVTYMTKVLDIWLGSACFQLGVRVWLHPTPVKGTPSGLSSSQVDKLSQSHGDWTDRDL